jgi:nitrogenase-associated protein
MSTIVFYEKPGCISNTRQKALLQAAGHSLEVHNLLTEAWTPDRLRPFFGNLPVADWFNRTAPQVKSGEVDPDRLDEVTALGLMVNNPILIRRPLMQVGDRRQIGFDQQQVDAWIGLAAADGTAQATRNGLLHQDLQNCPRKTGQPLSKQCLS